MTAQGIVIIVDNVTAVEDQYNSLEEECHKEVQDLIKVFEKIFCSLVLCFSCLSPKPLLHLLTRVDEVAATSSWNAFVLIILSKGKALHIYCNNNEVLQTTDILSCFSNVKCPKLFFFQTILTEDVHLPRQNNKSCCLSNSMVFSAYPSQKESSQVSVFIDCILTLCYNAAIGDAVEEIKKKIKDIHYIYWQRSPDFQNSMILANQSSNNK